MEYKHIKDIDFAANINSKVYGIFLARNVEVKLQKDGITKYIDINMCDKDMTMNAKKFGATDSEIEMMKNGGVYYAVIDVKPYAKSPTGYSCTLYNFDKFDEDPSNFIEWADGMEDAQDIIQRALTVISESIYKDLVYNVLIEHWQDFCIWSAANSMHHSTLGGLLVHTAEVIAQADQIADFWEEKYGPGFIDKSLLLSGALLHDIAKTAELNVDRFSGSTEYSTRAALETHITMCVSMIDVEAYKLKLGYQTYEINEINEQVPVKTQEQLDSEKEALSLLKHVILSHHGKLEWGSPQTPSIPEAHILHIADGLSAEMYRYNRVYNSLKPGESECKWAGGAMFTTYKKNNK